MEQTARAEAFKDFIRSNYSTPGTSLYPGPVGCNINAGFGALTSARDARSLQFGLRLVC
ncbi:MAG: hypothetical protein KJZ84_04740 [Bryobacteraceae bacterium]|nr:hypothetical protein [Bryobacteraceae bacterium]